MSGGTPTVSKRCPGRSTKRTRLPSASVRAKILVVMPPFERPMAWLWVPLLRPVRGGGLLVRRKQQALLDLADNEDWLAGRSKERANRRTKPKAKVRRRLRPASSV